MFSSLLESPIGLLSINANEHEVFSIKFLDQFTDENPNKITEIAKAQFMEYFSGKRNNFDFPMFQIGTDFQKNVWNELRKIDADTYQTMNPGQLDALGCVTGKPLALHGIAGRKEATGNSS